MAISSSEAGRQLAAARKPKEIRCAVCAKKVVALGRAKYCSNACRQRAKYVRKKSGSSVSR